MKDRLHATVESPDGYLLVRDPLSMTIEELTTVLSTVLFGVVTLAASIALALESGSWELQASEVPGIFRSASVPTLR